MIRPPTFSSRRRRRWGRRRRSPVLARWSTQASKPRSSTTGALLRAAGDTDDASAAHVDLAGDRARPRRPRRRRPPSPRLQVGELDPEVSGDPGGSRAPRKAAWAPATGWGAARRCSSRPSSTRTCSCQPVKPVTSAPTGMSSRLDSTTSPDPEAAHHRKPERDRRHVALDVAHPDPVGRVVEREQAGADQGLAGLELRNLLLTSSRSPSASSCWGGCAGARRG